MSNARNGESADAGISGAEANTLNAFFGFTGNKNIAKGGDFAVESFTDGKQCTNYDTTVNAALAISGTGSLGTITSGTGAGSGNAGNSYASGGSSLQHEQSLHELNDFWPAVSARRTGDGLYVGGKAQVLFADGHVEKLSDEGGRGNNRDGFIGAFKIGDVNNKNSGYALNASALDEVRGKIWVKDIGVKDGPGAGGGD
jgi:prepilin-type processing-associated H-X9-DG protein